MIKKQKRILFFFLLVVQLLVAQVAPSAKNDYDTADINTPLIVDAPGVLVNDIDVDNDVLTVTAFFVNNIAYSAGETADFAEGSIAIESDGSYIFTPRTDYIGDVSIITYVISDGTTTTTANLLFTVELIDNLLY